MEFGVVTQALSLWLSVGFIGSALLLIMMRSYSARRPFHRLMAAFGVNLLMSIAGPLVLAVLIWTAGKHLLEKRGIR